jgi:hypothetical protein
MKTMKKAPVLGAALLVMAAARVLIACGGGDDSGAGETGGADGGSAGGAASGDATTSTVDGSGGTGGDGGLADGGSGGDGGGSSPGDGGGDEGRDGGGGATSDAGDAGIFDASGFPPGLTACATCYADTCEPQAAACQADPDCEELFVCYVASGCPTAANPQTCITACAADAGLTAKETVEASELLAAVATACTSCIAQCPKPDGGIP